MLYKYTNSGRMQDAGYWWFPWKPQNLSDRDL